VERPALFVSDLHLSPGRPDMAARFLRFLAAEARGGSALYILGDLFDHWIGDDDADEPFNRAVLDALGALAAAGVEIDFQHGNRDFLMSGRAAQRGGLRLIHDPTVRDLFGTRTLLMHGDTLCTDDVRYQRFRARVRRPAVVRMFLALPRGLRHAIAGGVRSLSETEKGVKPPEIMDVSAPTVEAALRAHGYPRLIHGHTHRPGHHVHTIDGQTCERWVLGDWYQRASYLRCDARGCAAVGLD
jgi:UDP-2,3-diacylglucosamine hydrolase